MGASKNICTHFFVHVFSGIFGITSIETYNAVWYGYNVIFFAIFVCFPFSAKFVYVFCSVNGYHLIKECTLCYTQVNFNII